MTDILRGRKGVSKRVRGSPFPVETIVRITKIERLTRHTRLHTSPKGTLAPRHGAEVSSGFVINK